MSPAGPLRTNRDLYLFVAGLGLPDPPRDLESYLTAVWALAAPHRDDAALPLARFAAVLERAFTAPVTGTPPAPVRPVPTTARAGFAGWEWTITAQIDDLRAMRAAGTLANELRYFGVDAPSGARWYNFDPHNYLECAVAGTFGGWRPGDDTGRGYVPGKVAVIGADGQLTTADPQELDEPIVDLDAITWDTFAEFLWCGQAYE